MITKRLVIQMEDDGVYFVGGEIRIKGKKYMIKEMKCVDIGNTWTEYDIKLEDF